MGLYRLLGRELARRGHAVLSIDHATPGDALAGLRLLSALEEVDGGALTVLGHSRGAATALSVGIPTPEVARIVAMGPGVRAEERAAEEGAYFRRRALRYSPAPADAEEGGLEEPARLEYHMDYFARPDHKPLLLVQGELEDGADRVFLRQLHASMAGPATMVTVGGADHYMNVANFGPVVIYDRKAATYLLTALDNWLADGSGTGCGPGSSGCEWPGVPFLVVLLAVPAAGLPALGLTVHLLRRRSSQVSRQARAAGAT